MKGHAEKLNEKLNYALKEDNYEKLDQKYEKDQVLDLKGRMEKIILKLSTLKSTACLNMQILREEHDGVLNAANKNGTAETIEELYRLSQNLEDKM